MRGARSFLSPIPAAPAALGGGAEGRSTPVKAWGRGPRTQEAGSLPQKVPAPEPNG